MYRKSIVLILHDEQVQQALAKEPFSQWIPVSTSSALLTNLIYKHLYKISENIV
ncbi:hypothetical protein HXA32_10715 [Salipaludibacillus agaradhaerens]|nr:hypothetical protein [Salipaludibacillus agaradhaerens]UJW57853.1 hypothetical protein HXZ66_10760 [Bacillus sp. A116_S68]